jgi:hypothetical protein
MPVALSLSILGAHMKYLIHHQSEDCCAYEVVTQVPLNHVDYSA